MAKAKNKIDKRLQSRYRAFLGKGEHNPTPAERAVWADKGQRLPGSRNKKSK